MLGIEAAIRVRHKNTATAAIVTGQQYICLHMIPHAATSCSAAKTFGIQPAAASPHILGMTQQPAANDRKGGITVDSLAFAHGTTTVLDAISFSVAPGEHVAIIGRSGAG